MSGEPAEPRHWLKDKADPGCKNQTRPHTLSPDRAQRTSHANRCQKVYRNLVTFPESTTEPALRKSTRVTALELHLLMNLGHSGVLNRTIQLDPQKNNSLVAVVKALGGRGG